MTDFRKIAQNELSLSPLISGREKLTSNDLVGQEVTITDFDFVTITDKGEEKTFPALLLAEYPDHYYNGGALLNKLCIAWAGAYDGDVEEASNALHESGGVKVKISRKTTRSGNSLISVDVV